MRTGISSRMIIKTITTMQETEIQHPDLRAEFVKGNFCVTKCVAGFTSIAPDQGIEQENGH